MSVFDGSFWADGVWDSGLWANGVFDAVNPIVELFARLNGTGVAVDPINAAKVFSDTAGTTLATLNGTVARLDSTAGVAASFTNATAGQRPILRADGLEIDGVDDRLLYPDDPALRFGTTNFTIAFRFRRYSGTLSTRIFDKRGTGAAGTNPGWAITHSDGRIELNMDGVGFGSHFFQVSQLVIPNGEWQYGVLAIDRTNSTATLRINGINQTPVTIPAGNISGTQPLAIGAAPNGTTPLPGIIGRLLAIDKLLNPTDTATVEQWLQNLI